MTNIPFNRTSLVGQEIKYMTAAISNGDVTGDGPFTHKVEKLLEKELGVKRALLTTSCTHALEMSAILLDINSGDEVIVPSYTFVSSALAFFMHGAKIVFSDVRPDTFNLDENKLEGLVTKNTKAIVLVHYAGVACEMDAIMEIASRHNLIVIEDNAHGLYGKYKGRYLGTIGHMATQSFHGTKNFTSGEGGALLINDPVYVQRAEIIREKGTNRARFFRGQVDKYTWVDKGSSYVMSDILAAFLFGQLECAFHIQTVRKSLWNFYYAGLEGWANNNNIRLPIVPDSCQQAYHIFYLLMPNLESRTAFIEDLKLSGVSVVFHYLPLHSSDMGKSITNNEVGLPITDNISDCVVRLPMYENLTIEETTYIVEKIKLFCVKGT